MSVTRVVVVTPQPRVVTVTTPGARGDQGDPGEGVPVGGTTGQVLKKASNADFDTEWDDETGGGGAVTSVNGETGVVVLDAADVGADATGTAAAAVAAHAAAGDPHPVYLTAAEGNAAYDALGAATAAQAAAEATAASALATHHGPSSTDHDDRYYTEAEVDSALASKANTSHNHTLSQVTDAGDAAALDVGTTAGTVAAGDDSRIVNAVPTSRTVSAGTGLSGGGDLSANRSFAVTYGTTAGTATEGNDSRVTGALAKVDGITTVDAGSNLSTARPSGAGVVYWLFDNGTDPGTEGENVVNGVAGDLYFVAGA